MKKYILACIAASVAWLAPVLAQSAAATNLAANTAVAATNVAAQTAARTATRTGSGYLGVIIWGAIIAGLFFYLWSKGYLVKMRNYISETQEELRKCSWPTREELKGSTVVVMVTIALLGLFTVGVDWLLAAVMRLIT